MKVTIQVPKEIEVSHIIIDVPAHGVVPGEDGDYIILKIAADGTITNWPKKPDVSAFFGGGDDD